MDRNGGKITPISPGEWGSLTGKGRIRTYKFKPGGGDK